jgi:hypothetical protein
MQWGERMQSRGLSWLSIGLAGVILAGGLALSQTRTRAPSSTVVRVVPSASIVPPNTDFTVDVEVDGVTNLGSYEFTLAFDPDHVQALGATEGGFLDDTGRNVGTPASAPFIDNTGGRVSFGAFSWGSATGSGGSGRLARLSFRALAPITSTPLTLPEVVLSDPGATPVSGVVVENSAVQVSQPTAVRMTTLRATSGAGWRWDVLALLGVLGVVMMVVWRGRSLS